MKQQLEHIPINDAMECAGECPLCYIENRIEEHALDFVLGYGASYMESDTREMTDNAGFCRAHFKKMFDYGNSLGNAWILSTHYKKIINEMDDEFKKFKPGKEKSSIGSLLKKGSTSEYSNSIIAWIQNKEDSCFICDRVNRSFDDYINVFFSMYKKDSDFREKIKKSQGFCLSHFGELCKGADRYLNATQLEEFYGIMLPLMQENMERIHEDICWLIEKYDYRNKDADWKNSKDANQRGMQKLKGGYPGKEAYKMKK